MKFRSPIFWILILLTISFLVSIAKLVWVQYFVSDRSRGELSLFRIIFDNSALFLIAILIGVGIALFRNKKDENYQKLKKRISDQERDRDKF